MEGWRGGTHLHSHGDVLLADVVVVLVCVQHDDSIGQGETSIVAHERRAVDFLQRHTHSVKSPVTDKGSVGCGKGPG